MRSGRLPDILAHGPFFDDLMQGGWSVVRLPPPEVRHFSFSHQSAHDRARKGTISTSTRIRSLVTDQNRLGILAGTRWYLLRGLNSRGRLRSRTVRVRPRGIRHPLEIRMQTSSDPNVFDQIFRNREYEFLDRIQHARVIIDLGANVGFASALCLSQYLDAFVLSVEPDPENHQQCERNLRHYGNRSQLVLGGVWHSNGALTLSRGTFRDGREWATEVREARDGETGDVHAWDIPSLIAMCPQPTVDLLKIDIEGSETALFSRNTEWLDRVRNLSIELHGPECERVFRLALAPYEFDELRCGEYTVCLNLRRVMASDRRMAASPQPPGSAP